jgi:hypothetical protein
MEAAGFFLGDICLAMEIALRLTHGINAFPGGLRMTTSLRLPKSIANDPRAAHLRQALTTDTRPLWPGGHLLVRHAAWRHDLQDVLRAAYHSGRIVRSLEKAESKLAAEARGLHMADQKSGVSRGGRLSRLLLVVDDGAERFYRQVERVVARHAPRVMAVRLDVDAAGLGTYLFGRGATARLVMIDHKEAVGAVLLALADQWDPAHSDR